ncbi:hypothetical protein [Rhizorhapis sp. SPR117]|uniref:hypothetical protein n=1 Tax=Rhizorhapis sp. SPR117 TaxID=2912611 RepID=UPI001F462402|nr:hypothetical protein [Rhizorhapis sp. SPR117]
MQEKNSKNRPKKAGELMTQEEELEEGLIESMDASDPPSTARKGDDGQPAPSSGYRKEDWEDEEDEKEEKP